MKGGALISAVWLTFQAFFPADSGAKSRNVVTNRFLTHTDYQSLEKDTCEFVVRGAWQKFCQVCSSTVGTSSSKVGRSLDGGSVQCVLINT